MASRQPSECDTCRRIEQSFWANLKEDLGTLRRRLLPTAGEMIGEAMQGQANLLQALAGRIDWWKVNPYVKHKQLFEKTGDPIELTRMLRHVKIDDDSAS